MHYLIISLVDCSSSTNGLGDRYLSWCEEKDGLAVAADNHQESLRAIYFRREAGTSIT